MFYFQKEDFLNAKSVLSKFYHTDQYYIEKAGIEWVIKKNLAEILLYVELEEDQLIDSRLKSFKRRYTSYLKKIHQEKILSFLNYVEHIYKKPKIIYEDDFIQDLNSNFKSTAIKKEDIFVISFYAWIKSKIEGKTIYDLTLKLIS